MPYVISQLPTYVAWQNYVTHLEREAQVHMSFTGTGVPAFEIGHPVLSPVQLAMTSLQKQKSQSFSTQNSFMWKRTFLFVIFIKLSYNLLSLSLVCCAPCSNRRARGMKISSFATVPQSGQLFSNTITSRSAVYIVLSTQSYGRGFISSITFRLSASVLIQSRHHLFKVLANLILWHEFPGSLTNGAICSRPC